MDASRCGLVWMQADVAADVNNAIAIDPAALWLCQLPGMTPSLARRVLAVAGSSDAILRMPSRLLRESGVPASLVVRIVAGAREVPRVEAGLRGWQRLGITPLPLLSPGYPQPLHALADPPLVVYVQGRWPLAAPLCCVVGGAALNDRVAAAWRDLVAAAHPSIGFALTQPALTFDVPPRLLGLPFGLMLARSRLSSELWQGVGSGNTTLIAIAPPTAQPDPHMIAALDRTLIALSAALVMLPSLPDPIDDLIASARAANVPVWACGLPPKSDLPAGARKLGAGKAGARTLLRRLGVGSAGGETVQQERLF